MDDTAIRCKRQSALDIVSRLVKSGYTALFAGGYVRDMLRGGENRGDIDIVTNATPQTITGLFAHTIGVGAQFGVVVVVEGGIPFEVATFRSDVGVRDGRHPKTIVFADARCDAGRRDFTINGMFYDPLTDTVIDYVNGRSDLEQKIIRAIGDPRIRFQEDYLRLLRAVRFAARFGFEIYEGTWKALCENAAGIDRISPERVFAELDKMLRQPHPDHAFALLAASGLLELVLPEVAACRGVEQPLQFHPEGDVFTHTLKALGLLCPRPSPTLAWSVLLHDIGKKDTMQWSDRIRFNNHDQVGARMARTVLKRLRASNELIESVTACIENHMNFINVKSMRLATLKKLLSRPTISDECELHRIDCCASHGNIENYTFVKKRLEQFAREAIKPTPLIRGTDLISLGLVPGPIFSSILQEIYDLQLDEKVCTREQALELVRERWIRKKAKNSTHGTPD